MIWRLSFFALFKAIALERFMSDKCLVDMDYSSTPCLDYNAVHVYDLVLSESLP